MKYQNERSHTIWCCTEAIFLPYKWKLIQNTHHLSKFYSYKSKYSDNSFIEKSADIDCVKSAFAIGLLLYLTKILL